MLVMPVSNHNLSPSSPVDLNSGRSSNICCEKASRKGRPNRASHLRDSSMRWLPNHQVSRPHHALAEILRHNLPERIWADGDHRSRVHHVRAKTGPILSQDSRLLHWEETPLHPHPPGPADRYGKRHAPWPAHLGEKGSSRAPRAEPASAE